MMKFRISAICVILISLSLNGFTQFTNQNKGLKVNSNGRYLEYSDGKPFFWLGDTGWELFHGDRNPGTEEHYTIIRTLVKGIKKGDNGTHLFTYHPGGDCSSASFFHEEDWLDFNMTQTGHSNRKGPTYISTLANYCMFPVKPCLDGEPRYEDIPVRFWEIKLDEKYKENPYEFPDSLTPYGYFNDYDVRTAAYWSVFSGACGHTYGNGSVWCFWEKGRYAPIAVKYSWQKAMESPGCLQMGYLRRLMEQFGINNLHPDRNVITNISFIGEDYIAALRAKDGSRN